MYQKNIKESNEKKILNYIYQNSKELSIADTAKVLGLTFPTVKSIFNKFLEKEILVEDMKIGKSTGRKAQSYSLKIDSNYGVGIKISKESLEIILVNEKGSILRDVLIKDKDVGKNILSIVSSELRNFLSRMDEKDRKKILGVGVSIPGVVDEKKSILEISGKLWFDLEEFKSIFTDLNLKVIVDNEGNLSALSEKFLGMGRDFSEYILLNIDETITMSSFFEQEKYGDFHFKAARVEHMSLDLNGKLCECGNRGCWNLYSNINEISEKNMEEYLKYLSAGIKNIIFLYNPEKIIITGKITKYEKLIKTRLIDEVYKENIFFRDRETILFSELKDTGGVIGAGLIPIIDDIL